MQCLSVTKKQKKSNLFTTPNKFVVLAVRCEWKENVCATLAAFYR